jgi:hypothetical protein
VVDFDAGRRNGKYRHFCWPDYFAAMRHGGHPCLVNFLSDDERDGQLRWDVARQLDIPTS